VFTTATFIGYVLSGMPGAILRTAGIFLPAFIFVAISGPLAPRLRRSPAASAFLDGVNAASLALMAVVMVQHAHAAFLDLPTIAIGAVATLLLLRYQVDFVWPILGAMIAEVLTQVVGFDASFRIQQYANFRFSSKSFPGPKGILHRLPP